VAVALSIKDSFGVGAGQYFTISGAFFKFHVLLSMLIFHNIVARIHSRTKRVRPASLEVSPEAKVRDTPSLVTRAQAGIPSRGTGPLGTSALRPVPYCPSSLLMHSLCMQHPVSWCSPLATIDNNPLPLQASLARRSSQSVTNFIMGFNIEHLPESGPPAELPQPSPRGGIMQPSMDGGGQIEMMNAPGMEPQADGASPPGVGSSGEGEGGTEGDSLSWPRRLLPFRFSPLPRPVRLRPVPESISLRGSSTSNSRGSGGRDSFDSWGN
jgi:hypothetical protein